MAIITHRQPDYLRAFNSLFTTVWGSTPLRNDISNLSYFRAMTCFLGTEQEDLEDRRKLVYQYLSNDFSILENTDTINQLYRILPIEESITRILRNLCSLYTKAPKRKFENADEKIQPLYDGAYVNATFKEVHKMAKLCNSALVMPVVRDGEIEIDILPPDLFRFVTDRKDFKKILELWIPISTINENGQEEYTFKVWSDTEYRVVDSEGRTIGDVVPNRYGVIPAVFLQFNDSRTDIYGGGMWELVNAILDDNKLCFLANNDVVYTAFSVWVATNFDSKTDVRISPNKLLRVQNAAQGEGQLIPPSLESVSGNGSFMQIEELRDLRYRRALRKMGLPESLVSANPSLAPSGVAMQIDRQELLEIRSEDIGIFKQFEKDFYEVFAKIVNADLRIGIPETNVMSIDYVEQQEYIDPKIKEESLQKQFEYGIIGAKDFIAGFTQNETITDDQSAIDYIKQNRLLLDSLKTAVLPSNGL